MPDSRDELTIVPRPLKAIRKSGTFALAERMSLFSDHDAEQLEGVVAEARSILPLQPEDASPDRMAPGLWLASSGAEDLPPEGYRLEISTRRIDIRAASREGFFYALQTIRQLLIDAEVKGKREIPCCEIEDAPRFPWRGMHLDCSRHFIDKEQILRLFDLMALHKLNVFHWHLVDDQGWRIEIKKHPRLTEVGAWREENGARYGGYYTQDDVREIVARASTLGIMVVPEIEMPGHTKSSLAAYPHLSCHGRPIEVDAVWGIFKDVYCAGKDEVFAFLEDVLTEVAALFPSPYIHIGGDEVPKDNWKACPLCQERIRKEGLADEKALQSYFIQRISRMLDRLGKRLIGWDEITEGGTPPKAIVQFWMHEANAKEALAAGHQLIMSPHTFTYLNYPPEMGEAWPKWMVPLPLSKVYGFDPVLEWMTDEQAAQVLGGEAPLWTEWAPQELVEWQLFPRLCAFAEVVWSAREQRDLANFERRLAVHVQRLKHLGVRLNETGTASLPAS